MEMHGWRGGKIPSNHFQMKMIMHNNESQKKPAYFKQQGAERSEPNTTEHFLPIFT